MTARHTEPPIVARTRFSCSVVWAALALVLAALLVRVSCMLAFGVNEDGLTSNHHIANLVYGITNPIVEPFIYAAQVQVPINGLPHVLDVAALLAMNVYFFSTLALTKLALWCSRRLTAMRSGSLSVPASAADDTSDLQAPPAVQVGAPAAASGSTAATAEPRERGLAR